MNTTPNVTPAQAKAELKRRKTNRAQRRRADGIVTPVAPNLRHLLPMSKAELKAIAGEASTPKAKATAGRGPGRPKGNNPHTVLREAAGVVKRAHWHVTGENLTYAEACARMGTAPAREGQDATTPVSEQDLAFARSLIATPGLAETLLTLV